MSGSSVTTSSTLRCPHGGQVQIVSTNARAKADGSPLATAADTFLVSGCPYQLAATPPVPSPCTTVRWLVTDTRVTAGGNATISQSAAGLCLSSASVPQGPVSVVNTQAKVASQ